MKTLLMAGVAVVALTTAAMAEDKPVTEPQPAVGSTAQRGSTSQYVVPTAPSGNPGAQAGMNWTSRSGNTNLGGYVGGNTAGGYEGDTRFQLHF
jgi:opacity protein-like surface antigen